MADITVTVTKMGGDAILGPEQMPRTTQVKALRERALLAHVSKQPTQTAANAILMLDGEFLEDTNQLPEGKSDLQLFVVFVKLEMSDAERRETIKSILSHHKWGGSQLERALAFAKMPDVVRADEETALEAIQKAQAALSYVHPSLAQNRDFVLKAVRKNGKSLEFASHQFRADSEIVEAAMAQNPVALAYADEQFQHNFDLVRAAVGRDGSCLSYASVELRANKEVVMKAVGNHAHALKYASESLREDPEVVKAAVRRHPSAIQYARGASCWAGCLPCLF